MTAACASCASPSWLGWTAGDKADADELATQIAEDYHCPTTVRKCATSYGWDVLRGGAR